jgi:putative transposase
MIGFIESFNATLRNELLDGEIFYSPREAKVIIESWRPHDSLGYNVPSIRWSTEASLDLSTI